MECKYCGQPTTGKVNCGRRACYVAFMTEIRERARPLPPKQPSVHGYEGPNYRWRCATCKVPCVGEPPLRVGNSWYCHQCAKA